MNSALYLAFPMWALGEGATALGTQIVSQTPVRLGRSESYRYAILNEHWTLQSLCLRAALRWFMGSCIMQGIGTRICLTLCMPEGHHPFKLIDSTSLPSFRLP